MRPAWSLLLFTTLAGAAQGLVVVVALACLAGAAPGLAAVAVALGVAAALLVAALIASFFHLGHPARAWRSALMWRTSWMSREVIVLPAFLFVVAAWAFAAASGAPVALHSTLLPLLALVLAFALWYCTAMIYACLRFIQEWAHPLTIVNYTALGLSSGLVLAGAMAVVGGQPRLAGTLALWALGVTAAAWVARVLALRRNRALKPRSTLQSATGIHDARLVQQSMGLSGGSFNTREFFHGAPLFIVSRTRTLFQVFAFAVPMLLLALSLWRGSAMLWVLAVPVQFAGLLAERWLFFAQARHPQNLYYQVVS
jgi:sulfite dehydrogenase (quinone) subunit SoeC